MCGFGHRQLQCSLGINWVKFVRGIFRIFYILKGWFFFSLTVLSAAEQGTGEPPARTVALSLSFEFCQFVLSTF